MQFQQISKSSTPKNTTQKKTIFHQDKQNQDGKEKEEKNEKAETHDYTIRFAKQMRLMIHQQQNVNLRESIANLKKRKTLEGFSGETPVSIQQCFSFLNSAIQNARSLRSLDLSGMEIDPLLAIELGQGLQKNSSLYEINLSGCKLNSFGLQYIFSSIANHQTLQSINLFNNQGFNIDLINDINQFVFKGKNNLKKLKLTHCNISISLAKNKKIQAKEMCMQNFIRQRCKLSFILLGYRQIQLFQSFQNIRFSQNNEKIKRINQNIYNILFQLTLFIIISENYSFYYSIPL